MISLPFTGTYPVMQQFGVTDFSGEPPAFIWPDGSLDYYHSGPGVVRVDHGHCGIDYGIPAGTPLLACADGIVNVAGWDTTGFGNCVRVHHEALGITTLLGHLSAIDVSNGQKVAAGARLGLSGSTGNSTGPHLHISVLRDADGHFINPEKYLSGSAPVPMQAKRPGSGIHWIDFTVTVQPGGACLFDGPSSRLCKQTDVVAGTSLVCNAWMRGEAIMDPTTKALDSRHYHVTQGFWIASARVNGNAPGSTALV